MPFYHFTLDTPLSVEAATERMKGLVAPNSLTLMVKDSLNVPTKLPQPFLGSFDGRIFHMRRNIGYRNSFLPVISGDIENGPKGTRVRVDMFLHPLVALIMVAIGIGIVNTAGSLGPVAVIVLGLAVVSLGFFPEVFIAKNLLVAAFPEKS